MTERPTSKQYAMGSIYNLLNGEYRTKILADARARMAAGEDPADALRNAVIPRNANPSAPFRVEHTATKLADSDWRIVAQYYLE